MRHKTAQQKLAEWQAEAKERELEKLAMKHLKEAARKQRQEEREQVRQALAVGMRSWGEVMLDILLAAQMSSASQCKEPGVSSWTPRRQLGLQHNPSRLSSLPC